MNCLSVNLRISIRPDAAVYFLLFFFLSQNFFTDDFLNGVFDRIKMIKAQGVVRGKKRGEQEKCQEGVLDHIRHDIGNRRVASGVGVGFPNAGLDHVKEEQGQRVLRQPERDQQDRFLLVPRQVGEEDAVVKDQKKSRQKQDESGGRDLPAQRPKIVIKSLTGEAAFSRTHIQHQRYQ